MKIELHHIERAVRKQFVWTEDPKTRWAVDPLFNKGVKGLGATCFIGVATQMGFSLEEIKDYLDLEELDVEEKFRMFHKRMQEMLERRLSGVGLDKKDVTQLLSVKVKMSLSYLRLHHMKEYLPTYTLNH